MLDGTVVRPGGAFSLNGALGERTEEKGFVAAPQILAGRLEDAVGGGISQVATTLYNAAFFAGLRLDAHQPHQFYISRYPMGREATVSWGGPELVFTNDWKAGVLLKVSAWSTGITVRMYSSKLGRRVETVTEEPYGYRQPTTRTTRNLALAPGTKNVLQEAGGPGFTVEYTRKVYRGDELVRDERFRTRYDPQNAFVEIGPAKPKPKPKPKPETKPGTKPGPTEDETSKPQEPASPGDGSAGQAGSSSSAPPT
jgi:vancomycin resistance protein YoaR